MSGLRAALRLSWRDARRFKGRSALVVIMIGLPVLAVTAMAVLLATFDLTPQERLDRDLGTSDARIVARAPGRPVQQDDTGQFWTLKDPRAAQKARPVTTDRLAALLPPGSRIVPITPGRELYTGPALDPTRVVELDLRDPLTRGLYPLRQGRFPANPDEVVVSSWLARHGAPLGSRIRLSGSATDHPVVGIVDDADRLDLDVVVTLPAPEARERAVEWLVDTPGPVRWKDVRRLNAEGLSVTSRAVVTGRDSGTSWRIRSAPRMRPVDLAVGGLVVTMVVLEIVLLAGPAFAVGIRRRRRELALVAAQGGSARHLRSIVLADGFVLGGVATVLGVAAGLAVARAAVPILESVNGAVAGPYEVPIRYVAAVAVLGLGSAVAAAVVPARRAARADVVAALAGRPAQARVRNGLPLAGLALVAAGFVITLGWRANRRVISLLSDLSLATGALCTMVGLVLLTPWLVRVAGRLAARLPLPFRLAARDAVRNRGRTAPAVAAVAAATAGLAGCMIAAASAETRWLHDYHPQEVAGALTVDIGQPTDERAERVRTALRSALPGVPLAEVYRPADNVDAYGMQLADCAIRTECGSPYDGNASRIGGPDLARYLAGRDDPRAAAALAAGKVLVFRPGAVRAGAVRLRVLGGEPREVSVPAVEVRAVRAAVANVLVPTRTATELGFRPRLAGFVVDPGRHRVTPEEVDKVESLAKAWRSGVYVYVERGPVNPMEVTLLVLAGTAVVLVLGGTFAATGLAVADARPDLATLGAVGAPPGLRRLVTLGQAWFVAVTGMAAGTLAGLSLGVAAMESTSIAHRVRVYNPITVPWGSIAALVVALPLLAGLVAAAFTRARVTPPRRTT
ncbi:ABC transporter permease [Sphaerisporangium sp. NPDC005289]|uniref:ABC transporter permease n=1 Tax=Sphaerisporangium sp. NPDC005289 TaxID=3155247 RepID=UPI0033B198D3